MKPTITLVLIAFWLLVMLSFVFVPKILKLFRGKS
jgi:hypothetical protein